MYDEDRQTALAMYGRMFDEAADEAGLLELLVSPTRQAVVLARSYDAKARKTQIEQSESADFSDPDSVPAFIFIIDKTAQQALELGVKEANPVEGQFSIFDELPELEAFADRLEAACFRTLSDGIMTKDLVGLVEPGFQATAVDSETFLDEIAKRI